MNSSDWSLLDKRLKRHFKVASAEDRALRGRNLSADCSQINGRSGRLYGGPAGQPLPESEKKRKIHSPSTLNSACENAALNKLKNFPSKQNQSTLNKTNLKSVSIFSGKVQ